MAKCECCAKKNQAESILAGLNPVVCLVPRALPQPKPDKSKASGEGAPDVGDNGGIPMLDEEYIKKHFKVPKRALYLDHVRRPLITFPMTQEAGISHFNMYRKTKINQQILDGYLDASEAIKAPSIFPYSGSETPGDNAKGEDDEEEETIYIVRLPDLEQHCPIHNVTTKTPRYIWHSTKKTSKQEKTELKAGGGPENRPKPWLLSRITDFDLMSQW